jgi:hypothetical protein
MRFRPLAFLNRIAAMIASWIISETPLITWTLGRDTLPSGIVYGQDRFVGLAVPPTQREELPTRLLNLPKMGDN